MKTIAKIYLFLIAPDKFLIYVTLFLNWLVYYSAFVNQELVPLGIISAFVVIPLDIMYLVKFYDYTREVAQKIVS